MADELPSNDAPNTGGNALDMDIVLRTTDSAGAHTDTILWSSITWGDAGRAVTDATNSSREKGDV